MAHFDYYLPSASSLLPIKEDLKHVKFASRRDVSPYHDKATYTSFYHTNNSSSSSSTMNIVNNNNGNNEYLSEITTHTIHQKQPVKNRNYNQELYDNWLKHARNHHSYINDRYLESEYVPTPAGSVYRRNGDFIMTRKEANNKSNSNFNNGLLTSHHDDNDDHYLYGLNDNDEFVINKKNNRSVGVYFNYYIYFFVFCINNI